MLIGERVNAQGSRAVKRMLLAEQYDDIVAVGRGQAEGGAHALDVCVAVTERNDEAEQMRAVVRGLEMSVDAPLIIDSTDAAVIRAALEAYPGRAVVNSVNLENGRTRCEAVLPLVRDHGACVVALTIDEKGMANTADRKLEVATRIRDIACDEFGLQPHQLLFDALTFTLATGEKEYIDSAHQTIDGIRRIKETLPGVLTVLGLSNVSFGLSPASRPALNSVFLYHCVQAGFDAAIVNPAHITPYAEIGAEERELAEDLIFNRREDALARYIQHFDGAGDTAATDSTVDPFAGMDPPAAHPRADPAAAPRRHRGADRPRRRRTRPRRGAQRGAPARDEGGRRSLRRGRAHPPVRAAERRGDEARRRPAREVPRPRRGHVEGHRGSRHRVRRRARHRQEPRQHHPQQQRLHRARPRQAGAAHHDHRARRRDQGRRHRPAARCW